MKLHSGIPPNQRSIFIYRPIADGGGRFFLKYVKNFFRIGKHFTLKYLVRFDSEKNSSACRIILLTQKLSMLKSANVLGLKVISYRIPQNQ